MDRAERAQDLLVGVRACIRGDRANLWTALPGVLQDFDAATMSASVQPSIKAQVQSEKGVWSDVKLPLLTQVPVLFPSGGGFALTFPLASGNEGLLVFASRCIDAWWQNGAGDNSGGQRQADLRMHNLSDGFFIPGAFSNPKVLSDFNTTSPELRNEDRSVRLEMVPLGFKILGNVEVDGALNVTGDITWPHGTIHSGPGGMVVNTDLSATGEISAKAGAPGTKVTLSDHVHGGVQSGINATNPPTGGT